MPEPLLPRVPSADPLALTSARFAFLSAEWRRLCLLTWAVEPARLAPLLPPGLTLDTRGGDAFVSLVAFDFLRTRVLGVGWPGYRDFPEVNLRFYVREGERRGVAFVRELVPKRLIAWLARLLYNEPYVRAPMQSSHTRDARELAVEHRLWMRRREQRLRVVADPTASLPPAEGTAHFFKEHTWGYGTSRRGRLVRYEVRHPCWETYPVRAVELEWDFGLVYGEAWRDLAARPPDSVVLAEGSPVRVSPAG